MTVTVVDLVLEVDERALGTIVGRARLQGAAERAHGGLHDLTCSFRGFGVTPYPGVRVELGAETTLPHEIVLNARPGRVRATFALSGAAPG